MFDFKPNTPFARFPGEPNDPVERIRKFNTLAGNTDDEYNVRQIALYTGLQLEEMAEKMGHIGLTVLRDHLHSVGMSFKQGTYDSWVAAADPQDLLDDDVDQFVVTVGSMLSQGADIHGAISEVNRSNMSKVFEDGTMHRDENGKILKPPHYSPPELAPFVNPGAYGKSE